MKPRVEWSGGVAITTEDSTWFCLKGKQQLAVESYTYLVAQIPGVDQRYREQRPNCGFEQPKQ